MEKSQIKLTEETVQPYWKARTESDGVRTTGHGGYALSGQDKRYRKQKKFIFNWCPRNLKTLDYGCGTGRYTKEFERYLGIDFTDPLLDIAKTKHPKANFLLLHRPYLDCNLDFNPELIFIANVLQHNPNDVVLKILKSFIPIVKSDIMFGLYENTEAQSGHMRGRTGKEYVAMIRKYFKVHEWKSRAHIMSKAHAYEEHAFTLIKAGRK